VEGYIVSFHVRFGLHVVVSFELLNAALPLHARFGSEAYHHPRRFLQQHRADDARDESDRWLSCAVT